MQFWRSPDFVVILEQNTRAGLFSILLLRNETSTFAKTSANVTGYRKKIANGLSARPQ